MISIIVAASTNNVIGTQGNLPWRLSDDLKRFKKITMGKPIIMGRLTHESIGRPLPGRQNIVITRQRDYVAEGCEVVESAAAALAVAGEVSENMIIGGSEIYTLFLPLANRIYLTRVLADVQGDAYFPALAADEWNMSDHEQREADEYNAFDFSFEVWDRVSSN
jgi:dihydrofolate reductase